MQKTENFELNQWESHDPIRRADFNSDNAAIDAAIAANARALSDYRTANDAAVAKKAEQSAVTALTANLGSAGKNCRFAAGSYTGDDTYDKFSPNTLSFDFVPYLVVCINSSASGEELHLLRPSTKAGGHYNSSIVVTWDAKSVSWYSPDGSTSQYNRKHEYIYIAFGADE